VWTWLATPCKPSPMSMPLPDDVRAAMAAGNKVEAIRLLREHTGMGLADAKAAVESGDLATRRGSNVHDYRLPAAAADALAQGDKVEAIRLVRQALGVGLKEARDIVEAVRPNSTRPAPVDRRSSPKGIWIALALLAVVGFAVWSYLAGTH